MKTRMKLLIALMALAAPVLAGTDTDNLSVTATVAASCSVETTQDVAFGTIDSATVNTAEGTVTVTCTNGTGYSIALDDGDYYSSGRRMQGDTVTTSYLPYELYQDSGYITLWGDGTHGSVKGSLTGTGSGEAHTVYGRITAGQYPAPDTYADTVVVTVTF